MSVLLNVVPFFSLLVLNLIIYQTIKKKTLLLPHSSSRERRDLYVATILIIIVMVFASCHSIKTVINLIELFYVLADWGPNMNILVSVSHLLITINSSSNFAIYCFKVNYIK